MYSQQEQNKIDSFKDEFHFLSNFHHSPLLFEGEQYATAEHAYQTAKTLIPWERDAMRSMPTAKDAKKMGRLVTIRKDWNDIKIDVMTKVVEAKFRYNPSLVDKLLATEDFELIEGNTWGDTFWGVCNGHGSNNLGKILMKIRERYKNERLI